MGEIEADAAVETGRRHRTTRRASRYVLVLGLLAPLMPGSAYAQYGNVCQTQYGACLTNPLLLGSACACVAPNGVGIPGIILGGGGYGAQGMASPICRTFRTVCQIMGVAAVGTPCTCYGEAGQIVPP